MKHATRATEVDYKNTACDFLPPTESCIFHSTRPMPPHSSSANSSFSSSTSAAASAVRRRYARLFSLRALTKSSPSVMGVAAAADGPSCLFVGPIDTASKEMLEAFYHQARDSYYSGKPLIIDDMFDKVELKLRLYGSKSIVKYPRCSLMRQSTYADAEEDPSQVLALATVWTLLLAFGSSAFLIPTILTISSALDDAFNLIFFLSSKKSPLDMLAMLNSALSTGLGYFIGYPIASASVQALKGLWMKNLVALKGSCPNCGEEVFAFVKAETSILRPHGAQCHVCQSRLEFRGKVEQSVSRPDHRCVHGRVYLVPRTYSRRRI